MKLVVELVFVFCCGGLINGYLTERNENKKSATNKGSTLSQRVKSNNN